MLNLLIASLIATFPAVGQTSTIQDILDAGALDRKIDPCENFYQFSCGGWLNHFELPADKAHYWRQGNALSDHVEEDLNKLLKGLAEGKGDRNNPNNVKLGQFYKSCMQINGEDKKGLQELKLHLKNLEGNGDRKTVATHLAELELMGAQGLFDLTSDQDLKDSNQVIAFVDRGGMALPDPDYYLKDDPKSVEIRDRYRAHIAKMLELAGESGQAAERILRFESELAKHAMKKDDRRDVAKRFHPMTFAQVKALTPSFDWDSFLAVLGVPPPQKINVVEPEFMKALENALRALKSEDLTALLKFKEIHRSAYYIAGPLQKEDFSFWHQYLRGQRELPPQWKYCTQTVAADMSEALGEAYVASIAGSDQIREKTEVMFNDIKNAFARDLDQLRWMDAKTRGAAQRKLAKLGRKIGWPRKWRDYTKLAIEDGAFYRNELNSGEFETRRELAKIDKIVDRSEWLMSVWEPNAYYADANNEMVLPLGELVPPVFDPRFSEGANYASLGGSTIGHELTHGFDDAGKDMDSEGNFVTWWTAKAKKKFESQSRCFIKQTEAYEIIPGSKLRIRGKATLGENLADNGGIKIGLMALRERMAKRAPAAKFLEFDELQQYFLAYGQGWCSKIADQELRDELLTNFHPPPEFRVNVVLANQPEFAQAFKCKPGSRMAPKVRCAIW